MSCVAEGVCIVGAMHGGDNVWQGVCDREACVAGCDREECVAGGVHGRGHAWQGACMIGACVWGGAYMAGWHAWQGACMVGSMHSRGACMAGGCMAHMTP